MPFVERDAARIHYRDEGAGFPVVLHTGGAGDGTMWDGAGYTQALAGFRLILIDHRGRGRSSRVDGVDAHRPPAYVADVVAVADAVGVDAFGFVGYSMGADIGYRLAAAHPDRVAALISIGGVAGEPGEPDDPAGLIALLEEGGSPALSRAIEAEEEMALPEWLRRNVDDTDAAQFILSLRAWAAAGASTWDDLGRIACPAALIAGSGEAPPRSLERMSAAIPGGAATTRIEGRGHVGAFLDSEAVLQAALPVLIAGRERPPR